MSQTEDQPANQDAKKADGSDLRSPVDATTRIDSGTTRREFLRQTLRGSGAVGAGLTLGASTWPAGAAEKGTPRVGRRVPFGRTGLEIPDISFGSFALEDDEDLVRYALDRGITHFDTAESYADGRSEVVLGRALEGRRHEVTLTTKYWARPEDTTERQMKKLDQSLKNLKTDYIDVYLNHAVNDVDRLSSEHWQRFVQDAKKAGKIRAIGMSGHSGRLAECLVYALDEKLVDAILVAYNFSQQPSFGQKVKRRLRDLASGFDIIATHPELPKILARAHEEGVGVMAMKTLRGARKNDMRPYEMPDRTFAQAAFRFVLADPSVDGLVVSMKSREMIDEYLEASGSGPPDDEDLALLTRYESLVAGSTCQVGCGACLGSCPSDVPIADVMRIRMYERDYALPEIAAREYAALPVDAAACLECSGAPCAQACPNGLAIAPLNRETHRRLA